MNSSFLHYTPYQLHHTNRLAGSLTQSTSSLTHAPAATAASELRLLLVQSSLQIAAHITVFTGYMQNDAPTGQQAVQFAAVGALHDAAQRGDVAAVKTLLAAGVDVDAPDTSCQYGGTAATSAVDNQQPEVLRVLLEAGAAVNTAACRDEQGWTPLMLAAQGQVWHWEYREDVWLLRRQSPGPRKHQRC